MKIKLLQILCILATLSFTTNGQSKIETFSKVLQQKVDSLRSAADIPAMAFSCILPSGEQITVASGMKPEQRMLAGSTGKTFFASIALQLADQKKISLDDYVQKYLGKNSWYDSVQNSGTITIRMLMNHTSGIEEYYGFGNFMERLRNEPDKTWTPVECIRYTFNRPALFEAGKDWSYADTNYLLLGLIIEKSNRRKSILHHSEKDSYSFRTNKHRTLCKKDT